jgi:cephalosporin hydroxylase
MKFAIDTVARTLEIDGRPLELYSDEAFHAVSDLWLKLGWNQKYTYTFSWLGVPIIQLPEDMMRYQEVVARLKPDVIIETGIAHGGSTIFSASLCRLLGTGRVVAVDIEIRPHNRRRLEAHPLRDLVTLIEGSSIAPEIVAKVARCVRPTDTVLVVLDSDHSHDHVLCELEAYGPMVTPGSYIVATDGFMRHLIDAPRGQSTWATDNPAQAAQDFVAKHKNFVIEEPGWPFNESTLAGNITHWPDAWLKKIA